MALKADRHELETDISFFCNEATTRGGIVLHDTTVGSGAAMDQGVNKVVTSALVPANSKVPVGILLNDVVDKDLTRTHLNQHKDEVQKGGKVTILRKGYVVTNKVSGTPAVGNWAIVHLAGNISGVADAAIESNENLIVGKFLSTKDSDGYCKVAVNLP
jgi:hypothetical protein